jgi:hypothetical protein
LYYFTTFFSTTHFLFVYDLSAEQAEDALKKLEDKKKRDLDFLKKQNEKISQLQKDKRVSLFILSYEMTL